MADALYPRVCIGCGRNAGDAFRYVCWDCATRIRYISGPRCSVCGEPVEGRVDHAFVCHGCRTDPRAYDAARSACRYDDVARDAMQTFKYDRGVWLNPDLSAMLLTCFTTEFDAMGFDGIVGVPLHPARRRARGYNQAHLLGRTLAKRVGVPMWTHALVRVRATPSQTRLTAPQRASNVRGAFSVFRATLVADRQILLVDDVMTTGATVNECARCLKEAGAASVHVLTVARG